MADRYTRDELLAFQHEFDDETLLPEEGRDERDPDRGTSHALPAPEDEDRNPTVFGRHDFTASNNSRNRQACAKCGRTAGNSIHEQHPELRKAAIVSGFDMAVKAMREGDEDMARIHGGLAMRLLEGRP